MLRRLLTCLLGLCFGTIIGFQSVLADTGGESPAETGSVYIQNDVVRWAVVMRDLGGRRMPFVTDIQDGSVRLLVPGDGGYLGGNLLAPMPPMAHHYGFTKDTMRICSIDDETSCRTGRRLNLRREDVSFTSEGIEFHGELWKPGSRGCYPTVAIAQGSEASDRHALDPLPQVLAAHGIAALVYDKRGTGLTGGDWDSASIEDLALDLNAARTQVLNKDGEVDKEQIGLVGFSEGGWIIPRAAAEVPAAFLVSISGGAFTKGHSYMHKVRLQHQEQGLEGGALDAALAKEQGVIDNARLSAQNDDNASGFAKRIAYDPSDDWLKIKSPVLWVGGEWDVLEDTSASSERLKGLLMKAGNLDHLEVLFRGTNHAIFEATSQKPSDFFQMTGVERHPPGYWPLLLSWIENRTQSQPGRSCSQ